MTAITSVLYPSQELVAIIKNEKDMKIFREKLSKLYLVNTAVISLDEKNAESLYKIAPFTKQYDLNTERSLYYLCRNNHCFAPTYDLDELIALLQQ